jgi:predicted RND superfamily exporter protein
LPVVRSTNSESSFASANSMMLTEGSPKWQGLEPNQDFLSEMDGYLPTELANFACDFAPIYVSLTDHKATTLNQVLAVTQKFIKDPANQSPNYKLSLVGGNAGIDAATNIVIKEANHNMLLLVYLVVIVFCYIAFRSWQAVVCAVLPLMITSLLAQAIMVWLHIGIKVATLPVIALGVGIGVDYALYVLSVILRHMRNGASLSDAYYRTLLFTGRVVILTGITLATSVVTWIFAPIKFQADMGLLLCFMFLWNMVGAMVFLPALAHFLLRPKVTVRPLPVEAKQVEANVV